MTRPATAHRLPDEVAWLASELARGLDEACLSIVWVDAPVVSTHRGFALASGASRLAWHGTDGVYWVGSGQAAEITASGKQRFARARDLTIELFSSHSVRATAGTEPVVPRIFGGFSFQPGDSEVPPWNAFGEARFVLPRFIYRGHGDRAQLGIVVTREDDRRQALPALARELVGWRGRLQSSKADPLGRPPRVANCISAEPPLVERIEAALLAVGSGQLAKVVVADCQYLELDPPPDPAAVLSKLLDGSPTGTSFAFDTPSACFLGASPERLVLRAGDRITSEALAGSIRLSPDSDASALLASTKDLEEHAFVVRAIRDALAPVCRELTFPSAPVLRALRHVGHLSTPITARLSQDVHVLDLVERLHPTPAVGGSPTELALAWIARHEPVPRGWYAGPVGWVDAAGDGDFVVALRSGTLAGSMAVLHAGAGIVRDSNPEAELAEIDLKLATFRNALGVSLQ